MNVCSFIFKTVIFPLDHKSSGYIVDDVSVFNYISHIFVLKCVYKIKEMFAIMVRVLHNLRICTEK